MPSKRRLLFPLVMCAAACSSESSEDLPSSGGYDAAADSPISSDALADGQAQQEGSVQGDARDAKVDAVAPPDTSVPDSGPTVCGCLLGEGPYCGARAQAEAENAGCVVPGLEGHESDLLKCEADQWSVMQDCASVCVYDGSTTKLDDACELPECDCFVQVAWCGSGAAKKAATMGCQIPLLPEHNGDILYCPGGQWSVKQQCALGCVEAPEGTPDYCKSSSDYRLPWTCNDSHTCSNGNSTSSHSGKDEYAYDFAMPVGTTLRASRSGDVLRVRVVSSPGDDCYDGGGSACANYANTVEVRHSDGTVALYMHLSTISVASGDHVEQGDVIGESGNTGWSTGPHLHTQVQDDCGIWWCQSIPFHYAEDTSISAGSNVTSQNCQ